MYVCVRERRVGETICIDVNPHVAVHTHTYMLHVGHYFCFTSASGSVTIHYTPNKPEPQLITLAKSKYYLLPLQLS